MDVLHTAIEVTDLDEMRGFYENLLGLERTREFESGGHRNYYVAGTGPTELQFRVVDEKEAPAGIHHIAIATGDVDGVVAQATAEWDSTVKMEPKTLERKDIRLASITDPEGYTVHLIQE